jgi:protein required for attachment to host cells
MMPLSRGNIEVLLDSPAEKNYVVSAFADLTVKDGFRDLFDQTFRNQARELSAMLSQAGAVEELDANLDEVRRAIFEEVDRTAKGAAVFVSRGRGLRHVIPLNFPVENRLVVDEDPYMVPLLEQWHGEPSYLVAWFDSDHAHVFESHQGAVEEVGEVDRATIDDDHERDQSRQLYKRRIVHSFHERLHGAQDDSYLKEVAEAIALRWSQGDFQGLILLGRPTVLGAMRQLLPKDLAAAVVEEVAQVPEARPDDVAEEVARVVERWHEGRDAAITAELQQRWKEDYLVANGPTDVLDALQQGRATRVVCGRRRDLPGAVCRDCGYRFGAPSETCAYCGGACRSVNAVQEILRMALKNRIPVHLFRRDPEADPIAPVGGVTALLRAEANWAPDKATAQATQGH